MLDRILNRIREKIRNGEYVTTLHADEDMDDDDLTIFDVEPAILNGQIVERQRDRMTGESKYRLRGKAGNDDEIEVVAKLSFTGKLVIITVYKL